MRLSGLLGLGFLGIVILLGVKLGWDDYQQTRAIKMVPAVLSIADAIPLPVDAVLIKDFGPSTNEYSAVVWRHYSTNRSDEDVRSSVFDYATRSGYEGWKEDRPVSGRAFSATKGEFEIRLHLHPPEKGANFAVSANWYGAER